MAKVTKHGSVVTKHGTKGRTIALSDKEMRKAAAEQERASILIHLASRGVHAGYWKALRGKK